MLRFVKWLAYKYHQLGLTRVFNNHLYWARRKEVEQAYADGIEVGIALGRATAGESGSYGEGWVDGWARGSRTERMNRAAAQALHLAKMRRGERTT